LLDNSSVTVYVWQLSLFPADYDYTNVRERIDRATGKYDRYCGTVKTDDSPCTHLVLDGMRYLWWPQLSFCCKCCNSAAGCGVVVPNWMQLVNATYQGSMTVNTPNYNGNADEWLAMGLQSNYWYQTADAQPVELAQV
jgi:hypothetical protein